MNLKSSFLLVFLLFLMISCDEKRVFDEYKTVGNQWIKDSIVSFNFKQTDTTKNYNLFVNIRNNEEYEFNNLFLIVALQHPNGVIKIDTLQYEMTRPDGSFLGEGFTEIKENKLIYKEKVKFSKPGLYKLTIQQAIRKTGKINGLESLQGITEVGFRIESLQ